VTGLLAGSVGDNFGLVGMHRGLFFVELKFSLAKSAKPGSIVPWHGSGRERTRKYSQRVDDQVSRTMRGTALSVKQASRAPYRQTDARHRYGPLSPLAFLALLAFLARENITPVDRSGGVLAMPSGVRYEARP